MSDPVRAAFLSAFPKNPPVGFSRLYFGSEFCFWRFPAAAQILQARAWSQTAGWGFTLVTPVVGEDERLRLDALLSVVIPEMARGDEVVISDWGVMPAIRERRDDLEIVLGRTLSGQKRGPEITGLDLSDEQADYFRQGSWYSRSAAEFLRAQGIRRVELDNLLQGLAALPESLHGSLHTPFAMVTSSRNCPFRPANGSGSCPAPCGELFTLRAGDTEALLYQDGNTQFLRNEQLPKRPTELGIDRIVHHLQGPC